MQFSMKWILAGTAYVALAAAAFSRPTWMFADLLWVVSLLALVFAALLTCFARGRRQIAAAGFVVASACYLVCLQMGSENVPTERLLAAAGIRGNAPSAVPYSPPQMAVTRQRPIRAAAYYAPVPPVATATWPGTIYLIRSANAVGMMLVGGLGVLVGLLAYKSASRAATSP